MQEKNVTSEKDSLPDIKDNLSHSERSDMDDILEEVSFRVHNNYLPYTLPCSG